MSILTRDSPRDLFPDLVLKKRLFKKKHEACSATRRLVWVWVWFVSSFSVSAAAVGEPASVGGGGPVGVRPGGSLDQECRGRVGRGPGGGFGQVGNPIQGLGAGGGFPHIPSVLPRAN